MLWACIQCHNTVIIWFKVSGAGRGYSGFIRMHPVYTPVHPIFCRKSWVHEAN